MGSFAVCPKVKHPIFDKPQNLFHLNSLQLWKMKEKKKKSKITEKLLNRQQNLHNWNWLEELFLPWELKKMPRQAWIIKKLISATTNDSQQSLSVNHVS